MTKKEEVKEEQPEVAAEPAMAVDGSCDQEGAAAQANEGLADVVDQEQPPHDAAAAPDVDEVGAVASIDAGSASAETGAAAAEAGTVGTASGVSTDVEGQDEQAIGAVPSGTLDSTGSEQKSHEKVKGCASVSKRPLASDMGPEDPLTAAVPKKKAKGK